MSNIVSLRHQSSLSMPGPSPGGRPPSLLLYLLIVTIFHIFSLYVISTTWGYVGHIFLQAILALLTYFLFLNSPYMHDRRAFLKEIMITFVIACVLPLLFKYGTSALMQQGNSDIIALLGGFATAMFLPMWFYYGLFYQHYTDHGRFSSFLQFLFLFFLLILPMLNALHTSNALTYIDASLTADQTNFFKAYWETIKTLGKKAFDPGTYSSAVNKTVTTGQDFWNRSVNPDFETKVEQTKDNKVGVTLEPIEGISGKHFTHEPLRLFSTIRASTVDADIPLELNCSAKKDNAKVAGLVDYPSVTITATQSQPLLCTFTENTLAEGVQTISMDARFVFHTSAYVKRYIMDKQLHTSLLGQGVDPFTQFSITDRKPIPIHTPGPIDLGITTVDPLIVLPANQSSKVYVHIKLQNDLGWSGKMNALSELRFYLPKGFTVAKEAGRSGSVFQCTHKVEAITDSCLECRGGNIAFCFDDCKDYNAYRIIPSDVTLQEDTLGNTFVGCWLDVDPSGRILKGNPLAIVSFRTIAEYDYTVSRTGSVVINKMAGIDTTQKPAAAFCGYNTIVEIQDQLFDEAKSFHVDPAVRSDITTSCFPLIVGLVMQEKFTFDSTAGCVGNRCGITQFTPQMFEAVKAKIGMPDKKYEDLTELEKNQISAQVAGHYLDDLALSCKDEKYKVECMIGRYKCHPNFIYDNYDSCDTRSECSYCQDYYIPRVISYAYGYASATS